MYRTHRSIPGFTKCSPSRISGLTKISVRGRYKMYGKVSFLLWKAGRLGYVCLVRELFIAHCPAAVNKIALAGPLPPSLAPHPAPLQLTMTESSAGCLGPTASVGSARCSTWGSSGARPPPNQPLSPLCAQKTLFSRSCASGGCGAAHCKPGG